MKNGLRGQKTGLMRPEQGQRWWGWQMGGRLVRNEGNETGKASSIGPRVPCFPSESLRSEGGAEQLLNVGPRLDVSICSLTQSSNDP